MTSERFIIDGDLATPRFRPWVQGHVRRLGLSAEVRASSAARLVIDVAGPGPLLDALEMGCLLGPIEAWVETVRRDRLAA